MRYAIIAVLALVLAGGAMAQPMSNNVNVNLVIALWQQAQWQTDLNLDFGAAGGGTFDYWCPTLQGAAYSNGPDPAGKMFADDPWAGDPAGMYYETTDQIDVFVRSNGGMSMVVTPGGDMVGAVTGHTLPTYFTGAGMSWLPGFQADGTFYAGGGAPLTTPGSDGQYLDDGTGTNFGFFNGVPAAGTAWTFPNQNAFPMAGGPCNLTMTQIVCGTFTFHARVFRNGINDPADTYTNTLNIAFGP